MRCERHLALCLWQSTHGNRFGCTQQTTHNYQQNRKRFPKIALLAHRTHEHTKSKRAGDMNKCTLASRWLEVSLAILLLRLSAASPADAYGSIAGAWQVDYGVNAAQDLRLAAGDLQRLALTIYNVNVEQSADYYFLVQTADERVAHTTLRIAKSELSTVNGSWHGPVLLEARRYGYTELYVTLHLADGVAAERSPQAQRIAVVRAHASDSRIFTYIAGGLVVLMFLNLGTVLDMKRMLAIIYKPFGPLIGFGNRYLLMPALALGLGYLIFPGIKPLQLAIFYTALSPSGGLANICTMFLKGNVLLSIATTTVNSVLALAMMPLWMLLFAHVVYSADESAQLVVPYAQLAVGAVALVAALAVGVLLRVFLPRTTRFLFRFLKPLSVVLSLCLVALTVGLNAFAFENYTWRVFLASIALPVLGFLLAQLHARLFCRTPTDVLTLSVEVSVLNMSLPILLLQHSVEQPQLDLIIIVPIATALTSLLLVLLLYVVRRLCGWNVRQDLEAYDENQYLVKAAGSDVH